VNHDVLPRYLGKATDQGPRSEEPAARLSWDTARELATILTRALRDTAGLPENWKLELPTDELWVQAAARYPDFLPVRTFLPVPSMLWSRNEDGSNQSGFKGPGLEWCLDEGPLRSTLLTRVARGGKSFQGGATVGGTALDPSNGHSDTFVRLVLHGLAP
jgi:hypothetical protein